jgi:sigma-B regulation protein RsbQ
MVIHRKLTPSQTLAIHNVNVIGSGDPIVFAHGFGSDQNVWRHQVQRFTNTNQLILFDHVGAVASNFSAFDSGRYTSMYAFAADLLEILEALDLRSCVVVGHSMSGLAALLASTEQSDRIRKIVTIGSSACYRNIPGYRGGFDQQQVDALYDAMQNDYCTWASRYARAVTEADERPQDAKEFARSLSELRPDIALAVLRLALECDHRLDLPHVRSCVDVIQSGHDVAVPIEAATYLAQKIPKATLSVLHTTRGHLPQLTAPNLLNTILLRCCND